LFVLLAVAGAIIVASRSEKKPRADDSQSASALQPTAIEPPRHKPPAEKKSEKPAEKAKLPSPEPPPEKAKPASPTPPVESPKPRNNTPVQPVAPPLSGPPVLAVPDLLSHDVEVVFCIDTTGSMGGLLAGAKLKIWSICNQIASGKPVPHLKVGLVAYRDRGDEYVTRVYDLRNDLDAVQSELSTYVAAGGGDAPESVTDKRTLRIIFLVGDAPPHMDYKDDVKYPVTCKKAVEKGILINTVQCGEDLDCTKYWKDIAAKAGGEYVAIPQGGGVVAMTTPFDGPLAHLGEELFKSALVYGDFVMKGKGSRALTAARALKGPAAADRA
jgi:hypothetical protein